MCIYTGVQWIPFRETGKITPKAPTFCCGPVFVCPLCTHFASKSVKDHLAFKTTLRGGLFRVCTTLHVVLWYMKYEFIYYLFCRVSLGLWQIAPLRTSASLWMQINSMWLKVMDAPKTKSSPGLKILAAPLSHKRPDADGWEEPQGFLTRMMNWFYELTMKIFLHKLLRCSVYL